MKCRYKYCKNNNEVEKANAIKEGGAYFCKECYKEKSLKQEIEDFYLANMPQTTLQLLRKVIKQLINDNGMDAEYVLYVVKYIKTNNKPLKVPFGLNNYCNNGYMLEEFKKSKVNKVYKEMKNIKSDIESNENKVTFTYKPSTRKITDII